ncbi:MAG: cyclic nucleotide-binding domain-containing protein [Anaerolineaceae bacterium]|nr:cyclic nucleotide-binding domain-containing protein [Anaerolineaceae bacterium]
MTKKNETIDALKNIPIFLDLKPFQLARLATACSVVEFEAGFELISEGDSLDYTYILMEGDMTVEVFVPSRGNVLTSHLGPLDMCGWSALTPVVRQRTGTVKTTTKTRLLKMDSRVLIPMCEEDHDIGYFIYKRLSNVAARTFLTTRLQLMNLIVEGAQAATIKPHHSAIVE